MVANYGKVRALGRRSGRRSRFPVPRYFLTIRGKNVIEEDPQGTILPDTGAARLHAEHTIRELRGEGGYDDPLLMLVVKDDNDQTVLSLPFLPACA